MEKQLCKLICSYDKVSHTLNKVNKIFELFNHLRKYVFVKNLFINLYICIYVCMYRYVCMYVCISLYSIPFTCFESLPESVQTNLSKSPRNPQVICPTTCTEKICSVKSVELVQEFWTGSKMLETLNDF